MEPGDEEIRVTGEELRAAGREEEVRDGGDAQSPPLTRERLRAEAAEQASAEKSRLLAAVSHDLRTPLTTIMIRAELLEAGIPREDPAVVREHARYIHEASQHMLYLVEQLQSYVRMAAGRECVLEHGVDLVELCRGVERFIRPQAEQKGLALHVRVPEGPLPVVTDAGKVRQILVSLLSNAVKFTDRGEVGLWLRLREDAAVFQVWDTGVGIPSGHLEKIFEPFWQGRHGYRSEVRGSGLGLTVARGLVELLGGRVKARSLPGVGSRFSFKLPFRAGRRAGRPGE
ncbi:MAG: HAMP domain-containing sensor histidine kinase [Gemmatimonadota bacterium]